MRAALRLTPSSSASPVTHRGRHRFVQDGEVKVEVVNPRQLAPDEDRAALAELRLKLQVEQQARYDAEKALRAAVDANHRLQTRLTHTEMAAREVASSMAPASELQAEREARQTAEKALQDSLDANRQLQARLENMTVAARDATPAAPPPSVKPRATKPRVAAASTPATPRKRGRPAQDEPIEWWKSGWKKRFLAGR